MSGNSKSKKMLSEIIAKNCLITFLKTQYLMSTKHQEFKLQLITGTLN